MSTNQIRVIVCEDYKAISVRAASIVASVISLKPNCVLGLATGSSPIGIYEELIQKYDRGEIDFSEVTTYNLDEYYPIQASNLQSYHYFMQEHFFEHINVDPKAVHLPDGDTKDIEAACDEYEALLDHCGGIDIQILGIGTNGHIGFNEPSDEFPARTHRVDLKESTIRSNARFFDSIDEVPRQAISMGIGSIMKARRILLVANGEAKAEAVAKAVQGPITPKVPASALQLHPDVTFIVDPAAAKYLK